VAKSAQGVFPMLSYEDGFAAIEWLSRVFGFREVPGSRIVMPDGSLGHVQMETGHGEIMLSTSAAEGYECPKRHREHCEKARAWSKVPHVTNGMLVYVDNINEHFSRAQSGGAPILTALEHGFPGSRYRAEDFEGHRWMFMQRE
jgi:uncharacterized glyoxalase superfamily protein PhnB